ncbi:neural/ectodermal development factor IMP-L2-like [Plodia interpunctella]|uniref:neural/ectodermal development factor IMP-L2-like n=1 Tax=Plodia interpunctella TaxID=58824 RepID=UPI002368308A|nr:neural/ectodermal development factor IMP-L2-like [Plodia interpunctella]XP_053620730.1 neural/ectodermal development factor IMP-L2-like [Plodia interpunctella]XP_053620731.1 neural/ectodermal development factor IMP-L2-like [Plodia interpunctella]
MISLVSLLAAALMSLQCAHSSAALIGSKNLLDNTLQPNVITTPKKKMLKSFVSILGAPPERARLVRGSRIELPCEAMGHPTPTLQWLKNGEPIVDYEESANEIMSVHPSSITGVKSLYIVTEAASGDIYTCVATSDGIERMASTTVFVEDANDEITALEALLQRATGPIPTYSYLEVFQEMGTSLVLPCRAYSYGKTRVLWTFNGEEVTQASPKMRVLPSGDLLITSLDFKDMGGYSCTVKNMYGESTTNTFVYPMSKD